MKYRLAMVIVTGCAADDPTAHWTANSGPPAHVVGHAFVFGPNSANLVLAGATVGIAEAPGGATTTVAADGTFAFDVPSGGPTSFTLVQPGFHPNQSATIDVGAGGIAMLGFQSPAEEAFDTLANVVRVTPDPAKCQISTTVSRAGPSPTEAMASASRARPRRSIRRLATDRSTSRIRAARSIRIAR